jgi:transcriptional regulator with XRE-family HTH domain
MTLVATPLPVRPEPTQRDSSAGLLGAQLRAARQARGLTLYQAERLCGARWDYLQAIEQESWAALPRAQALQALRQYAGFLRVDVGDLATEPSSRPTWHYAIAVFAIVILVVVLGSVLLSIG